MNNIFIKNITALRQKNLQLALNLQNYVPTELPKFVQENGNYNISYKNRLIHNSTNPLAESTEIFAKAENSPISIHLIYGLGLGYLFQVASLNSKGSIVLYEPDLNILWLAFTLVDFSNDILKQNVAIVSTFEQLSEAVYKKSGVKNTPILLSLPSQRELDEVGFNDFVGKLQNMIGSFSLDLKYTQQKFYPSFKMLMQNLPNLLKEIPLAKFKDVYKGKIAVVVSAGPSLDRDIEVLKKYRDKYVLFTVGTAVKTLYANDIKPDFLCIIETYNSSRQIEGLDLSDVDFITEPYANPVLRRYKFKNIYSHISANNPINQFWGEIINEDVEEYLSKGTVSYTALNCARLLGFSKIVLVGQDLAYIEGQCYSKDSAYKDLICAYNNESNKWEIQAKDFEQFAQAISPSLNPDVRISTAKKRLHNLNSSLHFVKGIRGDMIPTESVYATFIKPLEEYVLKFNDRKYFNASLVGAQIDGFENIALEDVLKDAELIRKADLNTDFIYDKEVILNNIKNKLKELKEALVLVEEGKRIYKNLNNDIVRYRNINQDILKTLKKLTLNYYKLSEEFANKSKMFNFISISDKINIDYEMKIITEFNKENVDNLNKQMLKFYNNVESRILETERLINESINSKS